MTARPIRIAQTSTEAKKEHKRHGPSLNERAQRQLERAAELDQRAARLRDKDERSKAARKRREEKDRKEREARSHTGVGLATQMIGYSHTQAQLKTGMEAFLGFKKRKAENRKKDIDLARQLEAAVEEAVKEPWDDEEVGDTFDLPQLTPQGGDQWSDDELDDYTLLEVHDQVMSDPPDATVIAPAPQQQPQSPLAPKASKLVRSEKDADFVRLHGPVNKSIDIMLDTLPDPMIELLSQDASVDVAVWSPATSLLHKLNPIGLPPHRLRIKVGCVVTLLRDLNISSQLSRSQYLQVLRIEHERLECLVVDGQLQGTKTFLTRIAFFAQHRNDRKFPFQRLQFPIQVSKDFTPMSVPTKAPQASFRVPSMSGQAPRSTSNRKCSLPPTPNLNTRTSFTNPSFKLPGVPASKAKPVMPSRLAHSAPCSALDGWDDFLESGTQIARELSSEPSSPIKPTTAEHVLPSASISDSLPPISTQDFDFSLEDLDDSPELQPQPIITRPPTIPPKRSPTSGVSSCVAAKRTIFRPGKQISKQMAATPFIQRVHELPPGSEALPMPIVNRASASNGAAVLSAPARSAAYSTAIAPKATTSFSDFGLSTQDAVSFFEDDEEFDTGFGGSSIAVR